MISSSPQPPDSNCTPERSSRSLYLHGKVPPFIQDRRQDKTSRRLYYTNNCAGCNLSGAENPALAPDLAEEEQRHRAGTHMATGDRLIAHREDLTGLTGIPRLACSRGAPSGQSAWAIPTVRVPSTAYSLYNSASVSMAFS